MGALILATRIVKMLKALFGECAFGTYRAGVKLC